MSERELPNEYTRVERPLLDQLTRMGWSYLPGDVDVPYLTERTSFREVLLAGRLRAALRRINLAAGQPWLDDARVDEMVGTLERLGTHRLMEANMAATDLLLKGTTVEGDPRLHDGREQTVRYVDFEHPERNDFLAVNQFRVDIPGGATYIVPDVVLFVNGIPLVVIECKSPTATDPLEAAITQLLRYSNSRAWVAEDEGVERLFHYNQLLVATDWDEARAATIGASHEHYLEWKDTSPVPMAQVAAELGVERLSSQQTLVAGLLRPEILLDVVRNFTLFQQAGGATIKIVARYQQYRAVQEAIRRLRSGQTRAQHGESDGRGGIIWHTQGSGKSLTMVFLVRKLRTIPALQGFKVVVVTDRTDLERQLSATAALTGETVRKAGSVEGLKALLREEGADLVFAMIQKYQQRDDDGAIVLPPAGQGEAARRAAEDRAAYETATDAHVPRRLSIPAEEFPVLNESAAILVLVDEAHRSQASALHANLLRALPNCARIAFTGTPILLGERKRTHEIFGPFIDQYTIRQSEDDGATVPILYEGRTVEGAVADGRSLDQLFEDMFREHTPRELEALKRKYATTGNVLEAPQLIAAKAHDMLRHYVDDVLPNGFKAQVVAVSRLAAIRYREALATAQQELIAQLDGLDAALLARDPAEVQRADPAVAFLLRAHRHLATIRRLEFAAVISGEHNDEPFYRAWSDPAKRELRIERFKKPLLHEDAGRQDGLAFLCVKSMLLTGFDAPVEQVLYLDRFMQGHELLQAIARVNRTGSGKAHGLVVDYFGVARHLEEALAVYSAGDVAGALVSIRDELPKLEDRHRRVLAVFTERGIPRIEEIDACVEALRDVKARAAFVVALKAFLQSMDAVLPRPEALPYVYDARMLGFINRAAHNRYRDAQLNLVGAGRKVRQLIDEYVVARDARLSVPPISIVDAGFADYVESLPSDRARASEMEHAARHHITLHLNEDPAYYARLSDRLEEILQRFQDNWAELARSLRAFSDEVQQGRPADATGLDPRTQAPFYGILTEEAALDGAPSAQRQAELVALTVELVEHVRQEVRAIDFWRNAYAQNVLHGWMVRFLDDHDVAPLARQQAVADRLMELARARHASLVL